MSTKQIVLAEKGDESQVSDTSSSSLFVEYQILHHNVLSAKLKEFQAFKYQSMTSMKLSLSVEFGRTKFFNA